MKAAGRIDILIKRVGLLVCFLTLITAGLCGRAEEAYDGYIVKFQEPPVMLLSNDENPVNLEPLIPAENLFTTDEASAANVRSMPGVEYIEPDYYVYLQEDSPEYVPNDPLYDQQWNMPLVKMPYAWKDGWTGKGVKVGIIDSGIAENHEDLQMNIKYKKNFISDQNEATDTYGHGTNVAGIIGAERENGIGIAGGCQSELYILKAFEERQSKLSYVLAAINDGISQQCDIINLSLAVIALPENTLNSFRDQIKNAVDAGVILIAALGNVEQNDVETIRYPAGFDGVIAVGSVTKDGKAVDNAVHNSSVNVAAPGDCVYTTNLTTNKYGTVSGTSFAAPHVTAAAAILKEKYPFMEQDLFAEMLRIASDDIGNLGWDEYFGWGLLNVENLLTMDLRQINQVIPSSLHYESFSSSGDLMSSEGAKLSIEYGNYTMDAITAQAYLALYDAQGCLVKLNKYAEPITIPSGERKTVTFEGEVESGQTAKIFLFDNLEILRPIAMAKSYTN